MTERDIFIAAIDITDPNERATYVDKACAGDPVLHGKVAALLQSHESPGSFLVRPAVEAEACLRPTLASDSSPPASSDDEAFTFLAPAQRPDSLGRLGHYEVLQVLGRGGFGIVFRASDEVLQRVVALKVLAPQIAATSPARKRFLREARTSAQVRHEHVVQIYEVAEQPLPYLVMEFIPGETLQQRMDRVGPLEVVEALRIGRQIAEGLAAAHANDLIHRDIKPGNILLEGGQQKAKITDFGLARAADDASISQSGIIAGTPMYMAPEQALGQKLDQRADLFSLGSVLYQMVTGRPPFRANGTVAVLKRVADDTPRSIREIIPETPQWLCDIIAKLHAKNPDDRYQSAREVADLLADCEAQLKASAKLKDFSRISRGKVQPSGRWKWTAAVAVLLPVVVLAATELAGVTHLFRGQQAMPDSNQSGNEPTPLVPQEPLPAAFKNSIGMEFVLVPKGASWLGGSSGNFGGQKVEIPADFYLGKYEITQEQWEQVMGDNPSYFSRAGGGKNAVKDIPEADLKRFPVEYVSWDECQLFVEKLNRLEKKTGWVYRLPSEVEWEYACRGGPMADRRDSAFDYYFARPTNVLRPEQVNWNREWKRPCKVGSFEANSLGLFDLYGNVREWCEDPYVATDGIFKRVLRGSSFGVDSQLSRTVAVYWVVPSTKARNNGLRLVRVPADSPASKVKTPSPAMTPFTDDDVKRIAALPADQQIEEFRKELMKRNTGFDGGIEHKVEDGVVTELRFVTDSVTDISPIRVFNALQVLECPGTMVNWPGNGQLANLTPLAGMNLRGLKRLNLAWTKVNDAGLAHFQDCKELVDILLHGTQAGDPGLANFKECKNLSVLSLHDTQLSDVGLACFQNCRGLTMLNLAGTKVSDTGLGHFKECTSLTHLYLNRTQINGGGLANFMGCKNLSVVDLYETQVTDADLPRFQDCKKLTFINFVKTKVSYTKMDELKKTHPNCRILSDRGVIQPKRGP